MFTWCFKNLVNEKIDKVKETNTRSHKELITEIIYAVYASIMLFAYLIHPLVVCVEKIRFPHCHFRLRRCIYSFLFKYSTRREKKKCYLVRATGSSIISHK